MNDMLDLNTVNIVDSPDFKSYKKTVDLTRVVMTSGGFQFESTMPPTWMTHVPGWGKDDPNGDPNDPGDLLYTVCIGAFIKGQWYLAGFIQKFDNSPTGAAIMSPSATDPDVIAWKKDWAYDNRWNPLNFWTPTAGDLIAVMLVAGNGRGASAGGIKPERSNIQVIQLPTNGIADFRFAQTAQGQVSNPPVIDEPEAPSNLEQRIMALEAKIDRVLNTITDHSVASGNVQSDVAKLALSTLSTIKEVRDRQDRSYKSSGPISIVLHPVD